MFSKEIEIVITLLQNESNIGVDLGAQESEFTEQKVLQQLKHNFFPRDNSQRTVAV